MSWDVESVIDCLEKSSATLSDSKAEISFGLFDIEKSEGIGKDGTGNAILLLPFQRSLAFDTEYANFEPNISVTRVDTNEVLSHVAVLRCKINSSDKGAIEAIAAIFVGLLDLQKKFGMCGDAIWQMKKIFEEGLTINPGDEKIAGLIGELLFIRLSEDIPGAIDLWHSSTTDKYDFSSELFKVDVKSTFSFSRKHHFTSNQIRGVAPDRTYIASFLLERVEVGLSIADIAELITEQIDIDRAQKVHDVCLKTLGVPAILFKHPQVDFGFAKEKLRIYSANDIPMPTVVKGVLSMEWIAELDEGIKFREISDFKEAFSTLRQRSKT